MKKENLLKIITLNERVEEEAVTNLKFYFYQEKVREL